MIESRRPLSRIRTLVIVVALAAGLAGHVATDPYLCSKIRMLVAAFASAPPVVVGGGSTPRTVAR
jgi:hypothetical protein